MNLYLVRHGETAHNRDGLGLGREDVPLTDAGLLQAEAVATAFTGRGIARVLCSPLDRARQVADRLAASCAAPLEVRDELIEMDVGETEGMTFPAMRERYPDFLAQWAGPGGHAVRMPGGESIEDIERRLAPLLDAVAGTEADIALVSHNFVIRVALCHLLGLPAAAFRSFHVDVASISAVRRERGRMVLAFSNDRCHLRSLESSNPGA